MIVCTQLTFDLFLRLRSNYRLGIHPYVFCHISRNNISMGRIMYSILPSKVKISVFFPVGLPTSTWVDTNSHSFFLILNPTGLLYKIMHKIFISDHTDFIFGKLLCLDSISIKACSQIQLYD